MEWMLLPLRRYAEFSGRSRRMEYWMFALFNVVVMTVLLFVTGGFAAITDAASSETTTDVAAGLFGGLGLLMVLYALAIFIPSLAVTIRRLHDRDMSGWWYLGAVVGSLIPFLGVLVSLGFLVLMLLPGTPGPNRFGEDPKALPYAG